MADELATERALPAVLYRFRPFSTEIDKGRLRDILLKHRLHFARPRDFNDPFDPRPVYRLSSRERFLYEYIRKARQSASSKEEADRRERELLRRDLSELVASVTRRQQEEIQNSYLVLSLTATRDPVLLWSHYADKHSGVCIHIKSEAVPFGASIPVEYSADYPVILLPREDGPREHFKRVACTKALGWSYEEEFRLIRLPEWYDAKMRDLLSEWDDQQMILRPDAICGVTAGARMSDATFAELVQIVTSRDPRIPAFRARLHPEQFALMFDGP